MKKQKPIFLSIVIPCYNETANIKRKVLKEVHDYLKEQDFTWEVVISDDGSTDGSRELVNKEILKLNDFYLLENPHGGKPAAIWMGIKKAKGEYVLFADMDQSTPIAELTKLLPHLEGKNIGAVIGSRGLLRKNFPFYRKMGSIVFMALRKAFILPEIDDTQCGFKLFRKNIVLKAFPLLEFFRKEKNVKGWKVTSYDAELLYIIKKMGFTIIEVPVIWEDTDYSNSKGGGLDRYVKESIEMVTQIARVKLNDLRGMYSI